MQYGTNSAALTATAYDERGASYAGTTHYVYLTGLSPSRTYYFRVVSGGVAYGSNGGELSRHHGR